ncbi:MAG: adenosylcobinamide-GDP ribazoletransferase [Defluviitaleaceae bacterium]|nr:adenosylcobinamide-GDP ribazoletransferase [Defluviitaleaceae bacterium]
MMQWLRGFWMALGMFSGIRLPFRIWDEKLTATMLTTLPLVGMFIGAIWWGASLGLLLVWNLPTVMTAAILALTPFVIAGFIHLDGYMDTSDALFSRRPLQDKLRILTDPNVGAFAVVMLGILFLFQFAAMYTIAESGRYLALLIVICVLSRSCCVLSVFVLRHIPESNYISLIEQSGAMKYKVFLVFIGIVTIALAFLYAGIFGLAVSAAVVGGYVAAMSTVYKEFNGISGDLLGYSLVIGEICGLVMLALLQGAVL